jgi:queuine/archaeosine tRNA-ribosyltransferase
MEKIREKILSDSFLKFGDDFLSGYNSTAENSENLI